MIAAWMLSAITMTLLVAFAAAVAEPLARGFGRPTRWLWLAAMCIALLLPILQARAPSAPRVAAPGASSTPVATRDVSPSRVVTALAMPLALPMEARASIAKLDVAPLVPWDQWLVRAWIGMSVLVLAYLALAFAGARRLRRRLPRADVDGQRVLLSTDCGPAVLGVFHVETVIPQWALALAGDERRLILAHEGEHARGRDPLLVFVALVLLALQPWNVGLWLIVARLRFAVEADCDARVLARAASLADASSYGRLLLRVHAQAPVSAALRLTFVGTTSKLERRVRLVMRRGRGVRPLQAGASVCMAAALLVCAWAVPSPAAARQRPSRRSTSTALIPPRIGSRILAPEAAARTPATRSAFANTGVESTLATNLVAPAAPSPVSPASEDLCVGSNQPDVPSFERLRELVRERYHGQLRAPSNATIAVVGFLINPGTCTLARDTIDWVPRGGGYNGNAIAYRLFHIDNPTSLGITVEHEELPDGYLISFVMLPKPGAPRWKTLGDNECGVGTRAEELCSDEGGVVIRLVDSVRVLIAMVRNGAPDDTSRRRLFMYTSREPLSPLLSRTIPNAHVEYNTGMVYIVSRSGSDPTMLFRVGKPGDAAPRHAAETFDQGLGLSMYSIQGFTADEIRRLKPAAACSDGTVSAACYEVDGRVIRFPL